MLSAYRFSYIIDTQHEKIIAKGENPLLGDGTVRAEKGTYFQ